MTIANVVLLAATIVMYALVSHRLERWSVTMPIVFVGLGATLDAADVIRLDVAVDQVAILAEFTLAIILFGDAVRMNIPDLRRHAALPTRLLAIGLPLTILAGALTTWALLDGLSFWAAALIAAVLAPTDAAVGEAVVSDPSVPLRIRQALNVEAGLNDGLVVPVVVLCLEVIRNELRSPGEWARFILEQVGGGLAIGLAVGGIGAWAIGQARRAGWIEGLYGQLATLSIAVIAFGSATEVGANGFIAAFAAGLTFGAVLGKDIAPKLDEYTTDTGALLGTIAFFAFGNLFVRSGFEAVTVPVLLCAVLALTVGRMVPVAIATSFMGLQVRTVAFLGWFGPRGLASIVFGILLLEEELPMADELFAVVTLTVVASILAHGLTATPLSAAYGRWIAGIDGGDVDMAEERPTVEARMRHRRTSRSTGTAGQGDDTVTG